MVTTRGRHSVHRPNLHISNAAKVYPLYIKWRPEIIIQGVCFALLEFTTFEFAIHILKVKQSIHHPNSLRILVLVRRK